MDLQEQDNQLPAYFKSFMLTKIIIYNIVFIFIYKFSVILLRKNATDTGETEGSGLISHEIFKANVNNAAIALILLLIFSIIFVILYFREIHELKLYNIKFFKYIILAIFQIETTMFSICNLFILCSTDEPFSNLELGSPFLEFIRGILLYLPPFVLALSALKKPLKKFIYNSNK